MPKTLWVPGFRPVHLRVFSTFFAILPVRLLPVFSNRTVGGDRVRIEASDMGTMTTIKSVDQQLRGSKIAEKGGEQ